MQLSIIIVNYNVRYFLEQCLRSVERAMQGLQLEVIVVDNNSTDDSVAYLQSLFPWVKWIANQHNPGFGVANNQAVAIAKGEYILFLNPDTLLPEDCLAKCLIFMQMHPQAGGLGIKMLDGSGQYLPESKRGFPTALTSLFKLSGFTAAFPRSKFFAPYYMGHLPDSQNHIVDVLAGAFMLVRSAVLPQIGGAFDEQFFMYGEDIDLSYRIQQAGWQNWYFAESSIIHFKGESTKKGSIRYVKHFYQAMELFVKKHYSGPNALLFRMMVQSAIWAKAGMALGTSFVKPFLLGKSKANHSNNTSFQVIASPEVFRQIVDILQVGGHESVAITHILPDQLSVFEPHSKKEWKGQIIFGIDTFFTLKAAINLMAQWPEQDYAFFYKGGNCIISSGNKNTSGKWIVA